MRTPLYALLFLAVFTPFFASAATCPTLAIGAMGTPVIALQTFLHKAYTDFPSPTGRFGPLTQAAVKQWQREHGIEKTGTVGPKTAAAMKLSCASNSPAATKPTTTSTKAALIQALLAQVRILQDKIAAILAVATTAPVMTTVPLGGGGTTPPISFPLIPAPSTPVTVVQPVMPSQIASDKYWFAPLPGGYFSGSVDFMSLFDSNAQWQNAASHIQVFKLYGEWISRASGADLKKVVDDLKRRNIKLAIEMGALTPTLSCGSQTHGSYDRYVEGFTAQYWPEYVNRIKGAGGVVDYVMLDAPYYFGHTYDGEGACHWTAEKIAGDASDLIAIVKNDFPNATVGEIEPLTIGQASVFQTWLDTFKRVHGTQFPIVHLDVQWDQEWPVWLKSIESVIKQNGITFGLIYNGYGEPTDQAWITAAGDHVKTYELVHGGKPDQVIFQSWNEKPDYVLPETAPFTFTNLINGYFGDKSKLGPSTLPRGWLENITCPTMPGWAQDTDTPDTSVNVHFYFDGPAGTPGLSPVIVNANQYRVDLCTVLGSCPHAFSAAIPAQYMSGAHTVYAYGINSGAGNNSLLSGSPRSFQCQ